MDDRDVLELSVYRGILINLSSLDDQYPDNDVAMIVAARAREALQIGGKIQRERGL